MKIYLPSYGAYLIPFFWSLIHAQTLFNAISSYPDLNSFQSLLQTYLTLLPELQTTPPGTAKLTVLVPSNAAFESYRATHGFDVSTIPQADLQALLQYHILDGKYSLSSFRGELLLPTYLKAEKYDNRSSGPELQSMAGRYSGNTMQSNPNGQLVMLQSQANRTKQSRDTISFPRSTVSNVTVTSALGNMVNLTAIDGIWDYGLFQIIDGFLTLTESCTSTLQASNLSALDSALNSTGLAQLVNQTANLTCIAPSNQAFLQSGSPQLHADIHNLSQVVTYHTINQPVYGVFFQNGQVFTSLSGDSIFVTVNGSGVYLNEAKIIQQDILTDNGVLHVIDQLMSSTSNNSTATNSRTTSTASSPTQTPSNVASRTNQSMMVQIFGVLLVLIFAYNF